MTERRQETRSRSLLGGRVRFNRMQSTMDCVVRNIAPHGAMIVFPNAALTPSTFSLEIDCRGETHDARIIWRKHDQAGLALTPREQFPAADETARRMRRLQSETTLLRRQLDPRY